MPRVSSVSYARAADDGAALVNPLSAVHRGGSYMVAIGGRRSHRSFFFNGPELGFEAPEELYEMELHGPGVDVRGITAPGAPVIVIGHDGHIASGNEGLSTTNALYVEHLVPGRPGHDYYRGKVRRMNFGDETFDYKPSSPSQPHAVTEAVPDCPRSGPGTGRQHRLRPPVCDVDERSQDDHRARRRR